MQDYRRLRVWRHAHALVLRVHAVTGRAAWRGHASLRNQIFRAAESIATNIVEGCSRGTQREFARFLYIAAGSCTELEYHLRVARDLRLISDDVWRALTAEIQSARKMLFALIRRVKESMAAASQPDDDPSRQNQPATENRTTGNPKRPPGPPAEKPAGHQTPTPFSEPA